MRLDNIGSAKNLKHTSSDPSNRGHAFWILIGIAVLSHWQWFIPGFQFRWGDSTGLPTAAFRQFGYSYVNWLSLTDIGRVNIQPYQLMFFQLWKLCAKVGLSFPVTEQITMLWPIAILSFMSPYLLIKRFLKSDVGGVWGALVYGLGTSLLVYEGYEIFLALAFALLPLVLFAFDYYLELQTWRELLIFIVCINLLIYIDIRVAFLSVLLTIWYAIVLFSSRHRFIPSWRQVLTMGGCLIALNAFWLNITFSTSNSSITSTTSRTIFGNSFTDILHAITLVSGSWVNGEIVPFTLSGISPIMWMLPIFAFAGAFALSPDAGLPNWATTVFAGGVSLAAVMLAKQVNPPFPSVFTFFYYHVPGFSLFRVGTDFYIIATLGYAILIGRLVSSTQLSSKGRYAVPLGVIVRFGLSVVLISVLAPMISGKVGGLFVHRSEPYGLARVSTFFQSQSGFFRTLWLPATPDWTTYSLTHPAVSAVDLLDTTDPLHYVPPYGTSYGVAITSEIASDVGISALGTYSIRYIVLPPSDSRNTSPLYAEFGEKRSFYLSWLEREVWLKQVLKPFGGYTVFQVVGVRTAPLISAMEGNVRLMSSLINSNVLVGVLSKRLPMGRVLSVSMAYSQGWHAYVVPLDLLKGVCDFGPQELSHCKQGSGLKLLLALRSQVEPSLSASEGKRGQLTLVMAPSRSAERGVVDLHGPTAIIVVFGDALLNLILFNLAQIVLGVILAILMFGSVRRIWILKWRTQIGVQSSKAEEL